MKILLDENLPHDLRHFLAEHDVFTVSYFGWRGLGNGELLARAAENGFDALLSMDTGIEFQQNLADLPISVLLIRAPSNAIDDLRPLVNALLAALGELQPRTLLTIGDRGDEATRVE